jgi:hypothetical protein
MLHISRDSQLPIANTQSPAFRVLVVARDLNQDWQNTQRDLFGCDLKNIDRR